MIFSAENAYDGIVQREAGDHAVPASLVKGVIAQESAFKANASGDGGRAFGLMQLLAPTAIDMGFPRGADPTGLYEPATNIHLGTKYLAWIRARHGGSWADVVSAYNGGFRPELGFGRVVEQDGTAHCGGRNVPAGEYCNQKHVDRVMGFWRYFETGEAPTSGAASLAGVGWMLAIGVGLAALR